MRTNNHLRLFVFLIFLTYSVCSFSQLPCYDNYKIDKAALQKAKEFESQNNINNSIQSSSFVIRVYFHILNCSDGTLPGVTAAQLTTEFDTLVAAYRANNICFINAGYDNIYNTKLDSNFTVGTDNSSLFDSYRVPDCINIFYMLKIKGGNSACTNCGFGGVTLGIPNTFCLVAKSNVGVAQTVAHEVGHCMGLLHTFDFSNGYEDINGSNSSTAGDQITDTQADPFGYNSQSCYNTSSNGCTYAGSCKDPNGASNFSPPYTNLMAYWWNGKNGVTCYSALVLTGGQYTRVNSFLSTNSDLINCESPSYVTESGINISSGYLMASAINTLTTSGTVDISGSAIALLGGSTVTLEPGFDAYAYDGGSTLIRLSQCSGTPNFAIAEKLKPVAVANTSNILIAYPNPTSSAVNIAFTLAHNESKLSLKVYDGNMKAVKEISLQDRLKGRNTINVDLSKFSSGIYAVIIQGTDMLMKVMVVVQK